MFFSSFILCLTFVHINWCFIVCPSFDFLETIIPSGSAKFTGSNQSLLFSSEIELSNNSPNICLSYCSDLTFPFSFIVKLINWYFDPILFSWKDSDSSTTILLMYSRSSFSRVLPLYKLICCYVPVTMT
jgi:hypothetical protein